MTVSPGGGSGPWAPPGLVSGGSGAGRVPGVRNGN